MKNLIVVDLDKTLIPFDSFRKYALRWVKYYPFQILWWVLIRKVRLIRQDEFKKHILVLVSDHQKYYQLNTKIAGLIINSINEDILHRIKEKGAGHSVFLLLSASPNGYVSMVGDYLGWKAKGSFFNSNNQFIHLHGAQKVKYIVDNYPVDEFNYHYAISDSESDKKLLNMFENYDKI